MVSRCFGSEVKTDPIMPQMNDNKQEIFPSSYKLSPLESNEMEISWDQENTEYLIELYRHHPILYNTYLHDYKDCSQKTLSYQNIAQQMGASEQAIIRKIKGLRTQYCREKKNLRENKTLNENHVKWIHFKSMQFLDQFTKPKPSHNLNVHENVTEVTSPKLNGNEHSKVDHIEYDNWHTSLQSEDSFEDEVGHNASENKRIRLENQISQLHENINESRRSTPDHARHLVHKSPPSSNQQSTFVSTHQQCGTATSSNITATTISNNNKTSDDPDEIFGKYVICELKQIDNLHLKRIVKNKIQNFIFEAHCSISNNQS